MNAPAAPAPAAARGPALAMMLVGACCVVVGGLVAAITGPLDLDDGSWLAAYLVLVGGVAQYAMGQVRRNGSRAPAPTSAWLQLACWNLGNAGVIGGTLSGRPWLVDAGSVLLLVAVSIAFRDTWPTGSWLSGSALRDGPRRVLLWGYRVLLGVLIVSIPTGMVLSHLRHS